MVASDDKPEGIDPVRVTKMISDLRSAWVDLLSARCATDRLRTRYSLEEMARFGERATMDKAVEAVNAMCEYFSDLRKHITSRN